MAITVSSLKLTAKMDGWKTIRLPFWDWQFPVVFAVSFSEVYLINQPLDKYMGLQHPFNMVGKWEFLVPQALVWAMLVLGSCRAISFRELLKSYRNPIGSRIVFLCHHFSGIFLLLNFGRVAFFSGGMSNLLVTLSAWWQGSQHRESELRGAGWQTGESSGKGENGKGSEKPLVFFV